jgi:hypothetical protein
MQRIEKERFKRPFAFNLYQVYRKRNLNTIHVAIFDEISRAGAF